MCSHGVFNDAAVSKVSKKIVVVRGEVFRVLVGEGSLTAGSVRRFGGDTRAMERLCRCLRFALRCLGAHAAPLLPALAHAMRALYAHRAHSCVLYLASVLVSVASRLSVSLPRARVTQSILGRWTSWPRRRSACRS